MKNKLYLKGFENLDVYFFKKLFLRITSLWHAIVFFYFRL